MGHISVELADRFYRALVDGDFTECGRLFTGNAVVWHNYDLREQPKDEALAAVAALSSLESRFEIVERELLADGWLQQHLFHFSFPDGEVVTLSALHRAHVQDGLIARIDEYMDTGQVGQIAQKAQAAPR